MVLLLSRCSRGVLVLSYSSRLLSVAHVERGEGIRGDPRAQRHGEGRRSGLRRRPDIRALATA
jgi:hypothetical protein